MGTRINIEVGCGDGGGAVLFSNSHHPDFNAEEILREICTEENPGFCEADHLTNIVEKLLSVRYTGHGGHARGDRVFVIDTEPGDREKVLSVDYCADTKQFVISDSTQESDEAQLPLNYTVNAHDGPDFPYDIVTINTKIKNKGA
jgi:hypothetical protein